MALVNISEAAKLTQKSIKTIYRHIDKGRLSCSQDENGIKVIETSELERVYGAIKLKKENQLESQMSPIENNSSDILKQEIKYLKELLKASEERLKDKDKHIESLDNAIRLLEDQRQKTQVLQTAPQEEPKKEEKKGFFQRLFRS